jgi:RNA polymerase sigma factor (sigma-70 family)
MSHRAVNAALGQLHKLLTPPAQLSDADLLALFLAQRDEAAFAALVKRHNPMVLGVCRSVLRHAQDAEDACQASFLVLARNAASIRSKSSLAAWLHGVAYRLARKLEVARARAVTGSSERAATNPLDELSLREAQQIVHEELNRLRETYRLPLILCYLEGQTQDEAANRLGWRTTTLKGRLDRGRELLRKRLRRRGLTDTAPLLAAVLMPATSSLGRASATLQAAMLIVSGQPFAECLSPQVGTLLREGIRATFKTKLAVTATFVLLLGTVGVGASWKAYQAASGDRTALRKKEQKKAPAESQPTLAKKDANRPRVDLLGDPLPSGAIARIGTLRFFGGGLLAYTPDGKKLVSSSRANEIQILDSRTGETVRRIEFAPGRARYIYALAPDGKTLVTTGSLNSVMQVWDPATGKELRRIAIDKNGISFMIFSPDGKRLASNTGKQIDIWNVATWEKTQTLETGRVDSFAFLADGRTLVIAANGITWWDVEANRQIRQLQMKLDRSSGPTPISDGGLAVSPDGKKLAAVTLENVTGAQLRIYDAAGLELAKRDLGRGTGWCVSFSPDGRVLLCSGPLDFAKGVTDRGQTVLLDADSAKELYRWHRNGPAGFMTFSPDGKTLAHIAEGVIQQLDVKTAKPLPSAPGLPSVVTTVAFAPDSKTLMASCWGGLTGTWNASSGKPMASLQPPPKAFAGRFRGVLATALAADLKKAALVDEKGVLHVWEPLSGKSLCRIDDPQVRYTKAVFSADGKTVAVMHQDNGIRLWDAMTGKLIRSLPAYGGKGGFPPAYAFSPDGRVLATGPAGSKDDRVIRLWDTASGKPLGQFNSDDAATPHRLEFSHNGTWLAAVHVRSLFAPNLPTVPSVRLWDVMTRQEVRRIRLDDLNVDLSAFTLSPDDKTLAIELGNEVVLLEVATGQERGRFEGHRSRLRSLAFSHNGRLLASGSDDHTVLVWDVTGLGPDGALLVQEIRPDELARLWADLGGTDAVKAYRAVWSMVAAARQTVRFLAQRLRPVPAVNERRLAGLVRDLDSDEFDVRSRASKELEDLGELAEPALRRAASDKTSLELRKRVDKLLASLLVKPLSAEQVRNVRAVEVLEHLATPEARQVLETLAIGADGALLTREARAALGRLARHKAFGSE